MQTEQQILLAKQMEIRNFQTFLTQETHLQQFFSISFWSFFPISKTNN